MSWQPRRSPTSKDRWYSSIAPGDWTLCLERDGDLLLEQQLTIAAGEVTTVRW